MGPTGPGHAPELRALPGADGAPLPADRAPETRFEARLTTIVGGAGVGKTTLLGQSLHSEGSRVDVWLPCSLADRDGDRLLARLADACADALDDYRPDSKVASISAIGELIVGVAPDHVCLVFDDVHHLGDPEPLERLLAELPSNGHVLLSGRRIPAVSTARSTPSADSCSSVRTICSSPMRR